MFICAFVYNLKLFNTNIHLFFLFLQNPSLLVRIFHFFRNKPNNIKILIDQICDNFLDFKKQIYNLFAVEFELAICHAEINVFLWPFENAIVVSSWNVLIVKLEN